MSVYANLGALDFVVSENANIHKDQSSEPLNDKFCDSRIPKVDFK